MAAPLDGYDTAGDADALEELMRPYYEELLGVAYDQASDLLPVSVTFDVSNSKAKKRVDGLAKKIRNVAETTRDDVQKWVDTAIGEGLTMAQIAEQIRGQADIQSESRALTIARTETATAVNLGHTDAYEEAGVSQVEVADGDDDEDCASVNGETWTLDEARDNPIAHPNCTRAFIPVVE